MYALPLRSGWLAITLAISLGLGLTAGACKKSDPKQDATAPVNRGAEGATTLGGPAKIGAGTPTTGAGTPAGGGDDANDTSFQLVAEHPAPAPAGTEATARFVIHPGKGYHMNKEYPTKVTLEPPDGVTIAKPVLETGDAATFTETELTFAVKMTAKQQGEFTIPATVKFAVCTDATCDPKKKKIALLMKAQ